MYVTVSPGNIVTVPLMSPVPLSNDTLAPAEATAFHFTLVTPAGNMSDTAAPVTELGPLLPTTIV